MRCCYGLLAVRNHYCSSYAHTIDNEAQVNDATAWWQELTQEGGEGLVIKPLQFVAKGKKTYAQPALKVRGKEYLRIIYGQDYSEQVQLDKLRVRSLSVKRRMAMREFGLGIEALQRFVDKAPLRHIHECVFAVLAMNSEPVDPRL